MKADYSIVIYRCPQIFAFLRNDSHVSEIEKDYGFTSNSGGPFFPDDLFFSLLGSFLFRTPCRIYCRGRKKIVLGRMLGRGEGQNATLSCLPEVTPPRSYCNWKWLICLLCVRLCISFNENEKKKTSKKKMVLPVSTKLKNQTKRNEKHFLFFFGPLRNWSYKWLDHYWIVRLVLLWRNPRLD